MTSFETVAVSHRRMASVTRRQVCFIVSGAHRQVSKSRRRALALILRRVFEEGGFRIHVNAKWTLDARGVRASHSAHDSLIALDALAEDACGCTIREEILQDGVDALLIGLLGLHDFLNGG